MRIINIDTKVILVHRGFIRGEKNKVLDSQTARKYLMSRKQRSFTSVRREGDRVTLTRHYLRCAHCGKEVPAYSSKPGRSPQKVLSADHIERWLSDQLCLFEEEKQIMLNSPKVYGSYTCTKCGRMLTESKKPIAVTIRLCREFLSISCPLADIRDFCTSPWNQQAKLKFLQFPVTEMVVLNKRKGRVYIRLDTPESRIAMYDLTYIPGSWKSITYQLIQGNVKVRRIVKQFLCGDRPFLFEPTAQCMIHLTRFVGYEQEFYSALPTERDSWTFPRTLRRVSRVLHYADKLPRVYEKSSLPENKSVRRAFFQNPVYFFYMKEAVQLWQIIRDPNMFCNILNERFPIFALLCEYPGLFNFLEDYHIYMGNAAVKHLIIDKPAALIVLGRAYCAMSHRRRSQARREWPRYKVPDHFQTGSPGLGKLVNSVLSHGIPAPVAPQNIEDICVGRFKFEILRSQVSYYEAGLFLDNCLREWAYTQNPVVVIKEGNTIRAAVEVSGNIILQAKMAKNHPIEEDREMYSMFTRWKEHFGLVDEDESFNLNAEDEEEEYINPM